MQIALADYSESALLDFLNILTMNFSVYDREAFGPWGDAAQDVILTIRAELIRRWRNETIPPRTIEPPDFKIADHHSLLIAEGFAAFARLLKFRVLCDEKKPSAPFQREGLRLAQLLVLATSDPGLQVRN